MLPTAQDRVRGTWLVCALGFLIKRDTRSKIFSTMHGIVFIGLAVGPWVRASCQRFVSKTDGDLNSSVVSYCQRPPF